MKFSGILRKIRELLQPLLFTCSSSARKHPLRADKMRKGRILQEREILLVFVFLLLVLLTVELKKEFNPLRKRLPCIHINGLPA
ncbi:hypothetical protein HMPREF1981_00556 [Bacteroides pyogenes F0041]|uniref:Uncharacterized protein n=1 Tax=Bacteroides pyogenes F0041 TaxID=1321819 RepID=U2CUX4_9BACE|nr:hypothetical protein HMPREF1981_00556 [Bacteroides pyogenes F0041]